MNKIFGKRKKDRGREIETKFQKVLAEAKSEVEESGLCSEFRYPELGV